MYVGSNEWNKTCIHVKLKIVYYLDCASALHQIIAITGKISFEELETTDANVKWKRIMFVKAKRVAKCIGKTRTRGPTCCQKKLFIPWRAVL